jgi:sucrose-6-phosphate hydrolase SacC (GH32 family)
MNWRRDDQGVYGVFERTDLFAPESLLTADGRRVMWAWITSAGPDAVLLEKTIQSLPRELSLPSDGVLRIKPLRELEGQRFDPVTLSDITLAHPVMDYRDTVPPPVGPALQRIAELNGDACELRIVVPRKEAFRKLFGLTLFGDGQGGGLSIMLRPETGTLRVGTTDAPFSVADLAPDEDVELRIFIDNYLVEVFANDRQAVVAAHMDYAGKPGLDAFTVGAPTTIKTLEMWQLRPTNQGFRDARVRPIWEPAQQ